MKKPFQSTKKDRLKPYTILLTEEENRRMALVAAELTKQAGVMVSKSAAMRIAVQKLLQEGKSCQLPKTKLKPSPLRQVILKKKLRAS